jgi:hypothetical protein
MNNTLTDKYAEPRRLALITGTALMIMTLAAAFSYGFAHESLLVPGDADATLQNLISRNPLLKAEILGWIIILACDIIVAWSCYVFLKPVSKSLSLLGAWLRLMYSAILGVAIMNLLWVQLLSTDTDTRSSFAPNQLGEQAILHLEAFESIWSVGLILFGGHLLILGLLACRSKIVPLWIGILLLTASLGYVLIHLFNLFLAEYEGIGRVLNAIFILPMTAGELGFGLWMLFRGGKTPLRRHSD